MAMSRSRKELSTSSLLGEVAQQLGIEQTGSDGIHMKKKKKVTLSRKEKRKLGRKVKKENKLMQHSKLRVISSSTAPALAQNEQTVAVGEASESNAHAATEHKRKKTKVAPHADLTFEDPEDEEIERLEKLLGLKKDASARKKVATKLNKEYAQFEGLGDDFGDFLLGLDDIGKSDKPWGGNQMNYEGSDDDGASAKDGLGEVPDLLDDEEYPESDISHDDDRNEFLSGSDVEDNSPEVFSDQDGDGSAEEDNSESGSEDDDESAENNDTVYYAPSSGQDIYGNIKSADESGSAPVKYVPPHLRNKALTVIDEKSEKYIMLRRIMNGLFNRLSDETKDSIVRSMKELFETNSHLECCHCLNKCIMSACSSSTQVMVTLIPLYAAVVAALHITAGISIGANLLELLAVTFHKEVHKIEDSSKEHALIGSKYANNLLLLMMFLYALRIVHHGLITEILTDLGSVLSSLSEKAENSLACEGVVELLVSVFENVGVQLNQDDPEAMRSAVISVTDMNKIAAMKGNKRMQYLLDAAAELKSNKSKRNPSPMMETIAKLRKWLGSVKNSLGSKPGDSCLHITLNDFLNADVKGRWWKAGAAWSGRTSENGLGHKGETVTMATGRTDVCELSSAATSSEHTQLLALAAKMRMNTPTRRDIFVVMMSSMDPIDAYERLTRLDLRGKQDREIVKVLMECCGQEKSYNSFYTELANILCEQNRQHKSTFQFAFWDAFKTLSEGNFSDRRAINLARLLGGLVSTFHISLSILKVLDMSELSDRMILFLATLFLALFSSKVSEETFMDIFDRVATTADYGAVRDVITFFLQKYFTDMPPGLDTTETKILQQRRKRVLRIMSEMSVLDVARGKMEENEMTGLSTAGNTIGKKRKRNDSV